MKWNIAALGEIAEIDRQGVSPDSLSPSTHYVGLEHIDAINGVRVTETVQSAALRSTKFQFTKSHILFGKLRPYLCKIARPDIDGVCSTDILPILPGDQLDANYLYYFLRQPSQVELATRCSSGANLPRLSPKELAKFKIPLPPLSEQKRIAGILDAADALRVKRREAISHLDALLQSTFLTLFGDPVSNPKCPVTNLDKHLTFVTSGGRGWAKYYSEKGKRFIRSLDVQMNGISDEEIILVDPPDNAEAKRTKVARNDVLLTITGSRIGRVAKAPDYLEGSFISQHVAILRLGSRLMPDFLAHFLSLQQGGQIQIRKMQYGQTKPGLNFKQIRAFQIPIPPVEEQRHFTNIVSSIEKQKAQQRIHLTELDTLFASLQSRAFKGEL